MLGIGRCVVVSLDVFRGSDGGALGIGCWACGVGLSRSVWVNRACSLLWCGLLAIWDWWSMVGGLGLWRLGLWRLGG